VFGPPAGCSRLSVIAEHAEPSGAPCGELKNEIAASEVATCNTDKQAKLKQAKLPEPDPVDHRPLEERAAMGQRQDASPRRVEDRG